MYNSVCPRIVFQSGTGSKKFNRTCTNTRKGILNLSLKSNFKPFTRRIRAPRLISN